MAGSPDFVYVGTVQRKCLCLPSLAGDRMSGCTLVAGGPAVGLFAGLNISCGIYIVIDGCSRGEVLWKLRLSRW